MPIDELRVVVRVRAGAGRKAVREAVERAARDELGGRRTRVERLFPDADDPRLERTFLVAVADTDVAPDDPDFAARSFDLVHALQDHGEMFERVEADVPVKAYDPPEARALIGGSDHVHLPGTEAHDWSHKIVRCREAWELEPKPGGKQKGEGIRIGHPDSGYSLHRSFGTEALDLTRDRDTVDDDDDAKDPLIRSDSFTKRFFSPGHGTSTGSVIAGRGTDQKGVVGVAPRATLVPLRAVESTIQFFDTDVAKAVDHARRHGCHIISMSLGGKGFFGLKDAIQRAVDSGVIVMAAAGNNVRFVVSPASYDNCLAVAGTGVGDHLWEGSSRGEAVDIAAPGMCVWVAGFDWNKTPPGETVRRGHGTSYAVAHVAGCCALWLAHHGRDALIERYSARRLQSVFLYLLQRTCRAPETWDEGWGRGVIDATALLEAELPEPSKVPDRLSVFGASDQPADRISVLFDGMSREEVEERLSALLGAQGSELTKKLRRYEDELVYLLLADDEFRSAFEARTAVAAPAAVGPPPGCSRELAAVIGG